MILKQEIQNWEKEEILLDSQNLPSKSSTSILALTLELCIDIEIRNKNILKTVYDYIDYFYNNRLEKDKLNKLFRLIESKNYMIINQIIEQVENKLERDAFFYTEN